MFFADFYRVHIDAVPEPALPLRYPNIISAHLALPHESVVGKRPVLQSIRPVPLTLGIMPLIPELHRDLYTSVNQSREFCWDKQQECPTLLSVNANNSFRSRYPPSRAHFSVRNRTISSRPRRKVSRLRHTESGVYAYCTTSGFLVFQASCAALTFFVAVSSVKGGKGGRDSDAMLEVIKGRFFRDIEMVDGIGLFDV